MKSTDKVEPDKSFIELAWDKERAAMVLPHTQSWSGPRRLGDDDDRAAARKFKTPRRRSKWA